jgi:hypothetical protein
MKRVGIEAMLQTHTVKVLSSNLGKDTEIIINLLRLLESFPHFEK